MTWLRVLVPVIAVVAVFTVGVVLDGAVITAGDWVSFFGAGFILMTFSVAVATAPAFSLWLSVNKFRQLPDGRQGSVVEGWSRLIHERGWRTLSLTLVGLGASAFFLWSTCLLAVWQHTVNGCIALHSFWLLTGLGVGGATFGVAQWSRRGRYSLWVAGTFAIAAIVAGVWLFPRWVEWRQDALFEWYHYRATNDARGVLWPGLAAAGEVVCFGIAAWLLTRIADRRRLGERAVTEEVGLFQRLAICAKLGLFLGGVTVAWPGGPPREDLDQEARDHRRRHWAGRMIELRPENWRGYALRFHGTNWGVDPQSAVSDAEAAIRFGCNDPWERESFGNCFSSLGRFSEAAREFDTAATGYSTSAQEHIRDQSKHTQLRAALAHLDAGELTQAREVAETHLRDDPKDVAASFLLARVHIARGESLAACSLLRQMDDWEKPIFVPWLLAWVLTTSPDPAVRNLPEARQLVTEYLRRVEETRAKLKSKPPSKVKEEQERSLANNAVDALLVLAGCDAGHGDFEGARRHMREWKDKVKWDQRPHHNGFWARRFARLDECLREGKPYRDEPEKK